MTACHRLGCLLLVVPCLSYYGALRSHAASRQEPTLLLAASCWLLLCGAHRYADLPRTSSAQDQHHQNHQHASDRPFAHGWRAQMGIEGGGRCCGMEIASPTSFTLPPSIVLSSQPLYGLPDLCEKQGA